jgi:hypothetical protein
MTSEGNADARCDSSKANIQPCSSVAADMSVAQRKPVRPGGHRWFSRSALVGGRQRNIGYGENGVGVKPATGSGGRVRGGANWVDSLATGGTHVPS